VGGERGETCLEVHVDGHIMGFLIREKYAAHWLSSCMHPKLTHLILNFCSSTRIFPRHRASGLQCNAMALRCVAECPIS